MVLDTGMKMQMCVCSARYVQWEKTGLDSKVGDIANCVLIKPVSRKAVLFPHTEKFHGEPCVATHSNISKARGVAGEIRVGPAICSLIFIEV